MTSAEVGSTLKESGEKLTSTQTNPKGNTYERFLRCSKWVCDATT